MPWQAMLLLALLASPFQFQAARASYPHLILDAEHSSERLQSGDGSVVTVSMAPGVSSRFRVNAHASLGWTVHVRSAIEFEVQRERNTDLEFELAPASTAVVDGEYVVLSIGVRDVPTNRSDGLVLYYRVLKGALEPATFADYIDNLRAPEYEGIVLRPNNALGLDARPGRPDEIGILQESDVEFFTKELADRTDDVAVVWGALSSQESGDPSTELETGCSSGGSGSALGFSILLVGLIRLRRRAKSLIVATIIVVGVAAGARDVNAAGRCGYGFLSFWDSRSLFNQVPYQNANHTGWRLRWCDTSATACDYTDPAQVNCCYSPLSKVKLTVVRLSGGSQTTIETVMTGDNGQFTFCDPNWITGATYLLLVTYDRSGAPASVEIRAATGSTPMGDLVSAGQLLANPYFVGRLSVNVAQDTNSSDGDLAAIWQSLYETMKILDDQNENRHHKLFGSANAYDDMYVRYVSAGGNADCNTQTMNLDPVVARSAGVAHEFGHIYHGRVVGCGTAGAPGFPKRLGTMDPWGIDQYGQGGAGMGEGVAFIEGFPHFMTYVWAFDPSTALLADILSNWTGCDNIYDSRPNSNDISSAWNIANGLWDWIDTSSVQPPAPAGQDDNTGVDGTIKTTKQVMDALYALKNISGSLGQNNTGNEQIFNTTISQCLTAETLWCGHGNMCDTGTGTCVTGDVHGANLRDIVQGFPSGDRTAAIATIGASPCIRQVDDSHPFDGGYHGD